MVEFNYHPVRAEVKKLLIPFDLIGPIEETEDHRGNVVLLFTTDDRRYILAGDYKTNAKIIADAEALKDIRTFGPDFLAKLFEEMEQEDKEEMNNDL